MLYDSTSLLTKTSTCTRHMGHIACLRNINYRSTLVKSRHYLFLRKGVAPSFIQTLILFTLLCLVQSLVEILFVVIAFLLCQHYLPIKQDMALHLNKIDSPSLKYALCQIWFRLSLIIVLEKKVKM